MAKIRGAKSPVPKKLPAKNSGIFSGNGGKQKMDPVERPAIVQKTLNEAMAAHNRKSLSGK